MVSVKEITGAEGLSRDQLLDLYYKMLLARTVGQRERMLNRMGKGPFAVTGEGHEALQVGTAYPLKPGHDWIVPYYRDIGVALTIGQTPLDLLLAHLSREGDISSGGRNSHTRSASLSSHSENSRSKSLRITSRRSLSQWPTAMPTASR